jgi:hypothetical protein
MGKKVTEVLFVYSEQQIAEENSILRTLNKEFICGEVFIGNIPKKYTKIITEEEYPAMKIKYPDTKIIARIDRFRARYTPTKTILISSAIK